MAVFRINKTQDYTVMSNFHLKDRSLSLKSKGLLSLILSLPEDWNYTTRGLAAICKEGVDSIGTALKELECAGYIKRNRLRDEKGKITDTEYVIFEKPQDNPDNLLSSSILSMYPDTFDFSAIFKKSSFLSISYAYLNIECICQLVNCLIFRLNNSIFYP